MYVIGVGIFVPFELPDQLQLRLRVEKEAPDLDLAAKELLPLLITLLRWSVVVVVNLDHLIPQVSWVHH